MPHPHPILTSLLSLIFAKRLFSAKSRDDVISPGRWEKLRVSADWAALAAGGGHLGAGSGGPNSILAC